jgi:hypothetical protein
MRTDLIGRVLAQAGKVVESKSSALVPLQWKIIIFALFLFMLVVVKAPMWIDIGVFVLLAILVLQSSFSYHYFMKRNPDALRSEKHAISKYAIDKGLYGDSDMGMLEVPKFGNEFLLPSVRERNVTSQPSKPSREVSK